MEDSNGIAGEERHLIHRLFITTVTLMVFRPHRIFSRFAIACLFCVWLVAGSVSVIMHMAVEEQYGVEGQRHDHLHHKTMVKFVQNEKRDTLRRDNAAATFISTYSLRVPPSLAEPVTVDPSGQTAHSPPSCPLHQQISIYRL